MEKLYGENQFILITNHPFRKILIINFNHLKLNRFMHTYIDRQIFKYIWPNLTDASYNMKLRILEIHVCDKNV